MSPSFKLFQRKHRDVLIAFFLAGVAFWVVASLTPSVWWNGFGWGAGTMLVCSLFVNVLLYLKFDRWWAASLMERGEQQAIDAAANSNVKDDPDRFVHLHPTAQE